MENQSATLSCRKHYERLGPETRGRYNDRLMWEVGRSYTTSRFSSLFQVCQSNGFGSAIVSTCAAFEVLTWKLLDFVNVLRVYYECRACESDRTRATRWSSGCRG